MVKERKNIMNKEERSEMEKELYSQFNEMATLLKAMYDCFLSAGFTEEQAWNLVMSTFRESFRESFK